MGEGQRKVGRERGDVKAEDGRKEMGRAEVTALTFHFQYLSPSAVTAAG
jgi:hypothetical protein